MAYTKYSLTPANNNATPPDGAPEGMLPSAVNDTMRDMMAQIRDCGDGIRDGTYTMTAPKITGGTITGAAFTGNTFTSPVISGGSINNTPIGASTANTGAFTTLSASGATTFSGATVVSGSLTANTFSSSGATITGGSINSTAIGGSTAAAGAFTTLSASGAFSANGGATLGDASGDALTINSSAVSIPNGLNFDSNTLVIDAANNRVGVNNATPTTALDVTGTATISTNLAFTGTGNRITGDFSNATLANRVAFQTSTVNGNTGIGIIPNGTSTTSSIRPYNNSDPTNAGALDLAALVTDMRISSTITGTGTYVPLTFYTGGSERLRIDTSGNVGIGTTPTSYGATVRNVEAYIAGASGYTLVSAMSASVKTEITASEVGPIGQVGTRSNHALVIKTNDTERMRVTTSGNVGIGTSAPNQFLCIGSDATSTGAPTYTGYLRLSGHASQSVNTNGGLEFIATSGANGYGWRVLNPDLGGGSVPLIFQSRNNSATWSEQMRITSGGNLLVNQTGTASGADGIFSSTASSGSNIPAASFRNYDGAIQYTTIVYNAATSGDNSFILFGTEGTFTSRGGITYNRGAGLVAYNTSSDYRLKENIVDLPNALQTVSQLKPRQFDWKETGNTTTGFIAHELAEVLPHAVTGEKDAVDDKGNPVYQGVDTSFLVATLTAAIQELKAELDATKAEVAALKAK